MHFQRHTNFLVKLQFSILFTSHFVFRRQPGKFSLCKKNCQMKGGQNNNYDIINTSWYRFDQEYIFLVVNLKKQNLTCIVMPSLGGGLVNMVSSTDPLCRAPLPLGPALDPWLFCPLFPGESEPPETAPDVEPPPKIIIKKN